MHYPVEIPAETVQRRFLFWKWEECRDMYYVWLSKKITKVKVSETWVHEDEIRARTVQEYINECDGNHE